MKSQIPCVCPLIVSFPNQQQAHVLVSKHTYTYKYKENFPYGARIK